MKTHPFSSAYSDHFRCLIRRGVKTLLWTLFTCLSISFAWSQPQRTQEQSARIRIACVGNFITYGGGLKDKSRESYPAVLQTLLGDNYVVGNFGRNGATLLKKAPNAYVETDQFKDALNFNPDIVIIDLGINDTGLKVWPFLKDDFTSDYLDLISQFRSLPSKPEIWVCTMTPYFNQSKRFKAALRDWYWEVQGNIRIVAKAASTGLIDLHTPLYDMPHLFSDAVHPDKEGARIMAETIYGVISGDYGGLSVAEVFGSHMVLQRNKAIPIWGKADRGMEVSVTLAERTLKTQADEHGNWRVTFPARKEGGPYNLRIASDATVLTFDDILVGEVWVCSGQSNMTFKLSEAATGDADIPTATHPQIRLFNMKTADPSIRDAWEEDILHLINSLEYISEGWQSCNPESAASFSAVAYYFGKKLHEDLNVPIGLIHNSKGGSPTEAWIDRRSMEFHPILADLLQDWKKNPLIGQWCRDRGIHNTSLAANALQRHPYEPAYLFESCMQPWVGFPLRGAIWYQGEANVHNVALHEQLLTTLVNSWRSYWGDDFAFFYTQLSSFQSPAWPHFRDSQRRLLETIPATGMAVTTDVGDSLDIHPRRKKEVGERLALLALAKEYGRKVPHSGPLFRDAFVEKSSVFINFNHSEKLQTSDGKMPGPFELAGEDKVFHAAAATIDGNGIRLRSKRVPDPKWVRYGWRPFSRGNLVNGANLPASTFAGEVTIKQKRK